MKSDSATTPRNGWLLILLGAMTWGLDVVFRSPLTIGGIDPAVIVFGEHVLLTLAFLKTLITNRREFAALTAKQWSALLFVAWGASAVATWLYTLAFVYGSPLSAILLQKTQPLFALALAPVLLGEKRKPYFWPFATAALVGAYLLALGWLSPISALHGANFKAAILAISASALWGIGTVAGRSLSTVLKPTTLAAGRFALALPLLGAAIAFHPSAIQSIHKLNIHLAFDWIAIALIPGVLGMTLYYYGMRTTSASTATLAELAYPATALLTGFLFLHQQLSSIQLIGLAIIIVAVQQITVRKAVDTTHGTLPSLAEANETV